MAFFNSFAPIEVSAFLCLRFSLLTLSGNESESTIPLRKFKYLGIKSSNSSLIKTLRTKSFSSDFF